VISKDTGWTGIWEGACTSIKNIRKVTESFMGHLKIYVCYQILIEILVYHLIDTINTTTANYYE
jgi:hypothetical protein